MMAMEDFLHSVLVKAGEGGGGGGYVRMKMDRYKHMYTNMNTYIFFLGYVFEYE